MKEPSSHEITQLLLAWNAGDPAALERLTPLVYAELKRLARQHLRREHVGQSLQATELVNEVYLKLIDARQVNWQDRLHFFKVAARQMRYILVDLVRARQAEKRGGKDAPVSLDEALLVAPAPRRELIALNDALETLTKLNPRHGQVVELRYFGGLTIDNTSDIFETANKSLS